MIRGCIKLLVLYKKACKCMIFKSKHLFAACMVGAKSVSIS